MKKNAIGCVASACLLCGLLRMNAHTGGMTALASNRETQNATQNDELSWPRAELLVGSVRWMSSSRNAEKCLVVSKGDLKDPADRRYQYAVSLSGERYVAIPVPPLGAATVVDWRFDEALKKAGYTPLLFIPEKHCFLSGQQPSKPVGFTVQGYVKRAGDNIRLLLISVSDNRSAQLASNSSPSPSPSMAIFVSKVTPLNQIFKEPQ